MKKILYLLFIINVLNATENTDEKILFQAQKFKFILESLNKHYADSLDLESLCDKTFSNMLRTLDVQSAYYSVSDYKKIREGYSGTNYGVGLEIVKLSDTIYVYDVYKGSSADSAGILPGDKIAFIDGKNATEMSKKEADDKILGDTNTKVSIIIRRGISNNLTEYNLKRAIVDLPSVKSSFMVNGTDIGYIAYSRFSDNSDIEFLKIVKEMLNQGMKKILLDLRSNPGGYLNKAGVIADQFISGEKSITYTESRNPENTIRINSKSGDLLEGMPIIVLIDRNSASASEIIAGAVQDYDLGLVVGETSYGKGSVQKLWNLKDGSAIRITVGKYHTPSGRCIQKDEIDEKNKTLDPALGLNQSQETIETIQQILNKTGGKTHLPVYRTTKGRTVIGGGGIIPDIFVASDTTTALTSYFKSRGIFLEWGFKFIANNMTFLKVEFGNDSRKFNKEWQVTTEMLKELVTIASEKKIWNEAMFIQDKNYIIKYMKATLADLIFGHNEFYKMLFEFDNQAQVALLRFNEAEKLLKQ